MERKIGETFEIDGKKYKVIESNPERSDCDICAFDRDYRCISTKRGFCQRYNREDEKDVYFVEVEE